MDIKRPLQSFTGVGRGQTATASIPGGSIIDEITLIYPYDDDHFTSLNITAIRFYLGAEAIIDISGAEAVMLAEYNGIAVERGRITIPFKNLNGRTLESVHFTGLVTYPTDAINIEVDISDIDPSASVTLKAIATFRGNPAGQPRQFVKKIKGQSFPVNASGEVDISTLPRGPRIKAIHFESQHMQSLRILRDSVEIYNQTKQDVEYDAVRYGKINQNRWYHFDPCVDGFNISKMMVTASGSLEFKPFFDDGTQPASVRMLIESVHEDQSIAAAGVQAPVRGGKRFGRR